VLAEPLPFRLGRIICAASSRRGRRDLAAGLTNNGTTIRMSDQNNRTVLGIDHPLRRGDGNSHPSLRFHAACAAVKLERELL
jgi:hypothetical protein